MKRTILLWSLVVLGTQTSDVRGVEVATGAGRRWYVAPGAGYRSGYGYGYGGGYASTAAQGYAQGMASMIQASGEATEAISRASINNEEARSAYIDNQKKWTETYYEKKRISEANRDAVAARDREARDKYLKDRPSGMPPRLNASQLDPATGHISWPSALRDESFADQRKKIEELILLRNFTSSTSDVAGQLHSASRDMQADLKARINDLSPNEYIAARKFLDSLAYEGQYPAG